MVSPLTGMIPLYVNKLKVLSYEFYGKDEQAQGRLIKEINDQFDPPIPETENGMCYMLAMQFLLDYLKEKGGETPETVFDSITDNKAYLRQIAGNFREYIQHGVGVDSVGNLTAQYISELSRHFSEARQIDSFSIGVPPTKAQLDHMARGHLVVFFFYNEDETKRYGHAVAVVRDKALHYLYDPNFGVYTTQNPDEIYKDILPCIYNRKKLQGTLYAVNKKKLD